jgi:hypothetical protein
MKRAFAQVGTVVGAAVAVVGIAAAPASAEVPIHLIVEAGVTPLVCLDVAGGSKDEGAAVLFYACHDNANQRWRFLDTQDGWSKVVNVNSGKCLDVVGGSKAEGASVLQYSCNGGDNQRWKYVPAPGGDSRLQVKHSGDYLTFQYNRSDGLNHAVQSYAGLRLRDFPSA